MTVAFKLINKLALARDVFFRQGDVLFCECKMSFKNGPVHYTPADFMFYPYILYLFEARRNRFSNKGIAIKEGIARLPKHGLVRCLRHKRPALV